MLPSYLLQVAAAVVGRAESPEHNNFEAVSPTKTTTTTTTSSTFSLTIPTTVPTHTIAVGADGFKYTPAEYKPVDIGDIIEFRFYPGGHTVVRAEFGFPCIPYEYTGANKIGFFSGHKSPQVISNDLPTFQVRVNDTDPFFFYCSAPTSCVDHHMIGAINAGGNKTLEKQIDFAVNATYQLAPGDPFPSETASPTGTPSPTNSPDGVPSNSGVSDGGGHHHLSAGAIAGIVIGAAAVLVLGGGLIYLCGWRYGMYRTNTQIFPPPMADAKFSPSPKSPGHGAAATMHYSVPPGNDPYQAQSPSNPYLQSQSPIHPGTYPSPDNTSTHGPLMGVNGGQGYYHHGGQTTSPHAQVQHQTAPVELPATNSPGNSPMPIYRERKYSWSQGEEALYRPGDKS